MTGVAGTWQLQRHPDAPGLCQPRSSSMAQHQLCRRAPAAGAPGQQPGSLAGLASSHNCGIAVGPLQIRFCGWPTPSISRDQTSWGEPAKRCLLPHAVACPAGCWVPDAGPALDAYMPPEPLPSVAHYLSAPLCPQLVHRRGHRPSAGGAARRARGPSGGAGRHGRGQPHRAARPARRL